MPTIAPAPTAAAPAPASAPTIAPPPTVAAPAPASAPTIAPPPTKIPPTPTITPAPTKIPPTPTPEPPSEPTQAQQAARAGAIASEWAANNDETIAKLVVEVVLASPDVEERVPALLRANLSGLLEAAVADELGNSLGIEVDSVTYHGDAVFSVTLVVSGTVAVGLGPVEAADIAVPIVVTVDLDSEQATAWEADPEQADVTLR
ncbi:MAG: hypothetical protein OXC99_04490 [Chloroflexi bacterium]|nr:hypothetical protein [Chloroflexota bacterium]